MGSRLIKGDKVIASYIYKGIEVYFSNQNPIVGWNLRTIPIPNMNPHQIMKTTQTLVKQAIQKLKEEKEKGSSELPTLPKSSPSSPPPKPPGDGYENNPYPYIFKPPKPPDDLSVSGQVKQLIKCPSHEGESEEEPYCKHCGAPIAEGETVCHVCGKKVL
jgi:hypothetical protein